jgi:ABC-type lipoprotein export system ATPase subunit
MNQPSLLNIPKTADDALPRFDEFLKLQHLPPRADADEIEVYWNTISWEEREESGMDLARLVSAYDAFLTSDNRIDEGPSLRSLEVLRGFDKDGTPESFDLKFVPGDVICIVGPTGSGKSRLLADIECLAQRDTPTRRQILIDGKSPDNSRRFSGESGLVAQITQNMNFVMDLPVDDFLHMHAESRALADTDTVVRRVREAAVSMAGEPFGPKTQITQLSGGQSRALMIADAAYLSPKPIVLIDEIENAGVNRRDALKLFVEKGKIVLLSTHDPLLALSGARRLVIGNGAVQNVLEPTYKEKLMQEKLAKLDTMLSDIRERLRKGERIEDIKIVA